MSKKLIFKKISWTDTLTDFFDIYPYVFLDWNEIGQNCGKF